MAIFEQYPEYAMRTNKKGERETKPWVSGPSPLAMGLLAGGLGILSQPEDTSGWVTEGGEFDPTNIARGGLLGLQAYQDQNKNLQGQRKDFYTHLTAMQDQAIQTQKFNDEQMDREEKKKKFPGMIRELRALDNPAITAKLNTLAIMGQGDIDSAYNTAYNLLSAVSKQWEKPELVNGSLFQKSKDGEWKYITTPSTSTTKLKLSAPEITGQLFDSSANLKKWNLGGQKGLKPTGLDIFKYNSMYREKMRIDKDKIKVTNKLGESKEIIEERLIKGILDPTAYAIMHGMDTAKIKALGIDKPLIDTREYTSEAKRTITEAKDIAKVGIIAQVENSISQETFDPTTVTMSQYGQYFTSGFFPAINDFSKKARSYENMALAGSRMFGYLFSGATVKDDENRAMRQVLYPMPGDTDVDVERKKQFRETVLSLYKTYIHPDISKKLFKKIIINAKQNKVTTVDEIEEVVKAPELKKSPVLTKAESATTLEKIW